MSNMGTAVITKRCIWPWHDAEFSLILSEDENTSSSVTCSWCHRVGPETPKLKLDQVQYRPITLLWCHSSATWKKQNTKKWGGGEGWRCGGVGVRGLTLWLWGKGTTITSSFVDLMDWCTTQWHHITQLIFLSVSQTTTNWSFLCL